MKPSTIITVTANFTAEPIGDVLRFWTERLGLGPAQQEFSGYNQVFQELLDANSTLSSNNPGVNFVLIRLEDWARDQDEWRRKEIVKAATHEFTAAMTSFSQRAKRPTIVLLCPVSQSAMADVEFTNLIRVLEAHVSSALKACRVTMLDGADVAALYPVEEVEDEDGDRQGHIPFSQSYWVAMGTLLARKARTLLQPPHKVIALDADNTLWGGVAAEADAAEVQVTDRWAEVQEFLLSRKKEGMLLVLISKNREEDVAEVFSRPEMTLRRNDFVVWKVNWKTKSENLRAAALELNLGLDSFVFLDDNPMECAEVAARHPEVTVLRLPEAESAVSFLRHVWAFDLPTATSADLDRTEHYRGQEERKRSQAGASSFAEFFEKLDLRVEIAAPHPEQLERAAQLTQRTNQFNMTGTRRTAPELAAVLASGERHALLVRVGDRFGEYGEVGLCVYRLSDHDLEVENFLLSCRVLGKGVEHQLLSALGRIAVELGKAHVVIPFRRTERNEPAARFLEKVGGACREAVRYCLPAIEAMAVVFDPEEIGEPSSGMSSRSEAIASGQSAGCDFEEIAHKLGTVQEIQLAIRRGLTCSRPTLTTSFVSPRNSVELKLAEIWADVLRLDRVGIYDNLFDLGGDSIRGIQILSKANEAGLRLTLKQLFQSPTVAALASCVRAEEDVPPNQQPATLPHVEFMSTSSRFPLARLGQKGLDEVMASLSKTGR